MEMKLHIPAELESAAPEIKRFFDAMVFKLRKNAHKGKWEDMNVSSSLTRMKEETRELEQAIEEGNQVEILLEAADVANFCLILSNIAIMEKNNGETSVSSARTRPAVCPPVDDSKDD